MKPEISIIVPVYNVEEYLEDCLDSILAQSFHNFEVILVNDGSTDRSGLICDDYAKKDDRIKIVHQEYRGVSSARNVGVAKAKGEFIGFVDSDDRIDIHMYKNLYELCKETSSDISICKLGREIEGLLINGDGQEFKKEMDNEAGLRELFKGIHYRFSLCNKLFKKICFKGVVFPEGRIHEDLATTYKLFANASKSVYTHYIGYVYVKRKNSILTSSFNQKRLEAFIGWDEIMVFMMENYSMLKEEVTSSYTYWCVDNINYILEQVNNLDDKKKFLRFLQFHTKKYYFKILSNKSVAIKYKYAITLLIYNIQLLSLIKNMKKTLVRNYNLQKR